MNRCLREKTEKNNTIHKSSSSNLLVDKTKSIVKLIIFVFSIASIANKELKLVVLLALGMTLLKEYHKDQF